MSASTMPRIVDPRVYRRQGPPIAGYPLRPRPQCNSMEIRVRRATVADAPLLAALQRRTALLAYASIFPAEAPKPDLDVMTLEWQRRLSGLHSPNACAFVAQVGRGCQAGVIVACGDPVDPDLGHITRFYVDPKEWGQGVGRALYDKASRISIRLATRRHRFGYSSTMNELEVGMNDSAGPALGSENPSSVLTKSRTSVTSCFSDPRCWIRGWPRSPDRRQERPSQ